MSALLCVRGLSKRFDGLLALSDVHFDVQEGDAVGVVGPNGAGKSTLFHLISGALAPSAGTILYQDQLIQTWTPERRMRAGIARTFQKTRLFYGLTVEENLASGCFLNTGGGVVRLLCGAPRRERLQLQRRLDEILALTGLAPFRHRPAWQLSFGYQRRLGVGIALFVSGVICDLWSERASRRLLPWLVIVGLGFYLLTVTMPQGFILFVYYQAAAMGASLITYLYLMARKTPGAGWIALGLAISIVGAAIEGTFAFSFRLIWEFDHNSVYHLLQGLGFACLTLGLRRSLKVEA